MKQATSTLSSLPRKDHACFVVKIHEQTGNGVGFGRHTDGFLVRKNASKCACVSFLRSSEEDNKYG